MYSAFPTPSDTHHKIDVQMEHLNRKVQMRVQIQKPFEFCDGHNVLRSAAASFSEEVERMVSDACVVERERIPLVVP